MTPAEMKSLAERKRVEAFERGACGASVRRLELVGRPPTEAHDELLRRGFRHYRLPIVGHRTQKGAGQWRSKHGETPEVAEAACEYAYVHQDGGVVRIYPLRGPFSAYEELTRGPFARKSVLMPGATTLTLADEACVVTDTGTAVPKALRAAAGLKFDASDSKRSHELAETILGSHLVRLAAGPPPELPIHPRLAGLGAGFTIAFEKDFWEAATRLRAAAEALEPTVLFRPKGPDLEVLFAGSAEVAAAVRLRPKRPALASIEFHGGSEVISVEPIGFESSVLQLAGFLSRVFVIVPDARLFDNTSGADLTRLAARFPNELLGHEGPVPVE